jgi:hypothetical protein
MNGHISQTRLDELWDFGDFPASEKRLRGEILLAESGSVVASELATQVARVRGLQSDFVEAEQILGGIVSSDAIVLARVLLERGRVFNSSGRAAEAIPLFAAALAEFERAADAARDFGTPQQQVWAQEAIDETRGTISKPADQF